MQASLCQTVLMELHMHADAPNTPAQPGSSDVLSDSPFPLHIPRIPLLSLPPTHRALSVIPPAVAVHLQLSAVTLSFSRTFRMQLVFSSLNPSLSYPFLPSPQVSQLCYLITTPVLGPNACRSALEHVCVYISVTLKSS